MASKQEIVDKQFTEDGKKFIETFMKTHIKFLEDNKFPIQVGMVLGYGPIEIENKEDCLSRIKLLAGLIGYQLNITKRDDGSEVTYEIKY